MLRPHDDHTPRHLGTIPFRASTDDPHLSIAELPPLPDEEVLIDLLLAAHNYPFARHCRYVRFRESAERRTFAAAVFSPDPPGLRVGPWPGWRDIPSMPPALLRRGDAVAEVRFQFHGDEECSGELHGFCTLPAAPEGLITVESGHPELVPLSAELYSTTRPRAVARAVMLRRELHQVHPRLLLTPSELPALKEKTSWSPAWQNLTALMRSWDLPPELTPESKTPKGPERLRAEDRVMVAAILALVDPSAEGVRRARDAYFDFLARTASPEYEPLRIDTQSGETLFVLAVGYDWLHDQMSTAEREQVRQWLWKVADLCWSYLGYERRDYAQAHFLGCALGVLAFAFLFWEEHPRAREWAGYLAGVLDIALAMLPEDGFYPHGINLWIYEYGFLLRWLELFRICAGEDRWKSAEHWEHASRFRGSVTGPDGSLAMTFGDPQYRVSGDAWLHLLIGARTGEERARSLGEFLADVPHEGVDFRAAVPRRRVYEFLYGERQRDGEPPISSGVEVFADGAQISSRSPGALVCFRAGPPLGWTRYRAGEFGAYGHSDPSHGAFLLLHHGHPVVCGPGPVYRRETAQQACPTADGVGQVGDSCVWLPDFYAPSRLPPRPEWMVDGCRFSVSAQLAPAYLPASGIRTADRALYVDPERCIIGADRIECDRSRSVGWHLSSRYPIEALPTPGTFRLGPPGAAAVELAMLSPAPRSWRSEPAPVVPGYTNDGEPLYGLTLTFETEDLEIIWCLSLDGRPVSDYRFSGGTPWRISGTDGLILHRHHAWLYPEGFNAHQA